MYLLNSYYYSLLWQNGSDIYNDDLKSVRFNDEAGVEAVEYLEESDTIHAGSYMVSCCYRCIFKCVGGGHAAFACARAMQAQSESFQGDVSRSSLELCDIFEE